MADDPKTVKLLYDISKECEDFEHANWAASDEKAKIIIGFVGFVIGVALLWGAEKLLSDTTETIFIIPFIIPFIFFYLAIQSAFEAYRPQGFWMLKSTDLINKNYNKDYDSTLKHIATERAENSFKNEEQNVLKTKKTINAFGYFQVGVLFYLIFVFLFIIFNN